MDIPFTQFMRPNGRQKDVIIDRPEEIYKKADALISTGGRFTAEELSNGMVSLTYEIGEEDVEIEIVQNGPGVPIAVDKLVNKAHKRLKTISISKDR